jgi:hypothetical protein
VTGKDCLGLAAWGAVLAIGLLPPSSATAADAAIAAPVPAPALAAISVKRFALVIGNNAPPHEGLPTLRYADDDAIRWTLLLRTFGADVEVLTELDTESARLYGSDAPPTRAPNRAALDAAMLGLVARMKKAHADGHRTIFFFIYAGHGDTDNGEGYIALKDGPFYKHDFERTVLTASPADTNHVIVDACRSVFFAFDRGPGGSRHRWPEPYFTASVAARFPNTGFLLANSSGGASHEWEDFQAGIFSHELRSGFLGGADADGDGQITYSEIAAFVRVANQAVRNERFRPSILAQPPRSGDAVLLSVAQVPATHVRFGVGRSGHHVLEDDLGIRWADVHPSTRQNVTLLVPKRGSGDEKLFVRSLDGNVEYPIGNQTDVELGAVTPVSPTVVRRGALHEAFALLFSTPFDSAALVRSQSEDAATWSSPGHQDRASRRSRTTALLLGAGSLACFGASGALLLSANSLGQQGANATGRDRVGINAGIETRDQWSVGTGVAGGVFAVAAGIVWVVSRHYLDADSGP